MVTTARNVIKSNPNTLDTAFKVFLVWTFVLYARPQDFFTFLAPLRIGLGFTLLALVSTFFGARNKTFADLLKVGISRKYTVLYVIMIIGIPFADHTGRSFNWVFMSYLVNMIYFYLALMHLDTAKKIQLTLFMLCISILFYGVFGLIFGGYVEGRFAFTTMYDPNDMALFMVGFFPIALVFVKKSHPNITRCIAAGVLCIAPVIIIISSSRGGLLSLALVLAALFITQVGGIKLGHKIGIIAIIFIALAIFGGKIDTSRYETLFELEEDYNITSDTGRLQVWETGLKLIAQNPVTGVGARNFPRAFGYLREKEGRVPEWRAAHNAYIQIWAEIGTPGFIIFMGLILASMRSFWRMARMKDADVDKEHLKSVSGYLLIGFLGHLVGSFFLSQGYGMQFTMFFAMGAAIRQFTIEPKKTRVRTKSSRKSESRITHIAR